MQDLAGDGGAVVVGVVEDDAFAGDAELAVDAGGDGVDGGEVETLEITGEEDGGFAVGFEGGGFDVDVLENALGGLGAAGVAREPDGFGGGDQKLRGGGGERGGGAYRGGPRRQKLSPPPRRGYN
jgi:hypothetical protein